MNPGFFPLCTLFCAFSANAENKRLMEPTPDYRSPWSPSLGQKFSTGLFLVLYSGLKRLENRDLSTPRPGIQGSTDPEVEFRPAGSHFTPSLHSSNPNLPGLAEVDPGSGPAKEQASRRANRRPEALAMSSVLPSSNFFGHRQLSPASSEGSPEIRLSEFVRQIWWILHRSCGKTCGRGRGKRADAHPAGRAPRFAQIAVQSRFFPRRRRGSGGSKCKDPAFLGPARFSPCFCLALPVGFRAIHFLSGV